MDKPATIKSSIAYERIRDLILTGAKLPGTHLVLADLEKELEIGRGPLREALMRLDRTGLVRIVPFKGVVVAPPPSLKEIEYIYSIRVQLELILALEAMRHMTPQTFIALEAMLERMKNFAPDEFVLLDRSFHAGIYAASKLEQLCFLSEKVFENVITFLVHYPPNKETCIQALEEHNTILKALRNNDAQTLTKWLTINIQHGASTIREGYTVHPGS